LGHFPGPLIKNESAFDQYDRTLIARTKHQCRSFWLRSFDFPPYRIDSLFLPIKKFRAASWINPGRGMMKALEKIADGTPRKPDQTAKGGADHDAVKSRRAREFFTFSTSIWPFFLKPGWTWISRPTMDWAANWGIPQHLSPCRSASVSSPFKTAGLKFQAMLRQY
jgi:hypothetical protein